MTQTYPPATDATPNTPRARSFPILRSYADAQRVLNDAAAVGCIGVVIALPWAMIAPHEPQAHKNHGQSLARLAERGGLSAEEACAVLEDRPWAAMDHGAALARLWDLFFAREMQERLAVVTPGGATTAYAEGIAARRAGGPTVANPYSAHSVPGTEWLRGWSAADRELRV